MKNLIKIISTDTFIKKFLFNLFHFRMLVNSIKLKLKNKEIQVLRKNEVKYRTKNSVRLSRFDQSIKAKNC